MKGLSRHLVLTGPADSLVDTGTLSLLFQRARPMAISLTVRYTIPPQFPVYRKPRSYIRGRRKMVGGTFLSTHQGDSLIFFLYHQYCQVGR